MSNDYPQISLLPGRHKRVTGGHPWAFANEIAMTEDAKALPPGALVRLATDAGETVGVAGFNPHALIAARMIDRNGSAVIDRDFLAGRLRSALALRERLFDAPFYRLVHAEADGLPGIVVDRFGDAFSVQLNCALAEALRTPLLAALDDLLAPSLVVLRNDSAVRRLEGLDQTVETVRGDAAAPVEITENGTRFLADLGSGQKTGWFYDQRDNRRFMAALSRDASVLDIYAHTGGFGLQAAAAGASAVTIVDRSEASLALARRAAQLNGLDARCDFVRAEAFAEMERLGKAGARFQVVIADPPAFIKAKKDLKAGIRGYRKTMRLAARLVAPGGCLFVASCSHHMTAELFDEQIRKTLLDANRTGRVLRRAGAAPDHPLHPFLPESGYLKAVALQLD